MILPLPFNKLSTSDSSANDNLCREATCYGSGDTTVHCLAALPLMLPLPVGRSMDCSTPVCRSRRVTRRSWRELLLKYWYCRQTLGCLRSQRLRPCPRLATNSEARWPVEHGNEGPRHGLDNEVNQINQVGWLSAWLLLHAIYFTPENETAQLYQLSRHNTALLLLF
jgi:hypothetical protein